MVDSSLLAVGILSLFLPSLVIICTVLTPKSVIKGEYVNFLRIAYRYVLYIYTERIQYCSEVKIGFACHLMGFLSSQAGMPEIENVFSVCPFTGNVAFS